MTIGVGARVVLDSVVYDGDGTGAISLFKGATRYISSKGGNNIVTPFATIGISGTDFWVGEIDGVYGMLLLRGAVVVSNDGGSVILDEPLQGRVIYSSSTAPADPTLWPGDRRARALAGAAFN